jgi:uncharacterized 2Fe-2S/4Fe-4S cluster protein (DUF4445 family)
MTDYIINFEPLGRRGTCRRNESLLDCARRIGVGINSVCGGQGTCQSCKVQILGGTVSKPRSNELDALSVQQLSSGWRLACQTYPHSDCRLNIPTDSMNTVQRTQVEGLEAEVRLEPPVKAYHLKLPGPSSSDLKADTDRLIETLNRKYRLIAPKPTLILCAHFPQS